MIRTITATAIVALTAGAASAQGLNYARLSYDYNNLDDGSDDLDVGLFQGEIEYSINQFVLGANVRNLDFDGDGFDGNATFYDAWGGYTISPQALVGIGLTGVSVDDGDDFNGGELFGQYVTAQYGAAARIELDDFDEDNVRGTLYGEYRPSQGLEFGLTIDDNTDVSGSDYKVSADYDDGAIFARAYVEGNTDDDGGIIAVRGHYNFAGAFRASAVLGTTFGDDFDDLTSYAVGGGYQFVEGAWFDLGYGQLDFDDGDNVDRIQAVISFETGRRLRLDNQFEQDGVDDNSAVFGNLFF